MKPSQRDLRRLVEDRVIGHVQQNPSASYEEVYSGVADGMREDFGETDWLELLLKVLQMVLPLLLVLLNGSKSNKDVAKKSIVKS